MIKLSYDEDQNLITVRSEGFLDAMQVREYGRELRAITHAARRKCGRALTLVFASEVVQSDEVMAEFAALREDFDFERDRMAVIVSTSLSKLQIKRSFVSEMQQAFVSERAARMWLFAYEDVH